ncbi:MAG: glycosyltransferase family 4 protein [Armatimonadota bacterium]|nr:glycosyltransferase family 4 protein [Armatimonadota bacterium]
MIEVRDMRIAVLCSGYGLVARGVETFLRELMTRLTDAHPDWQFDVYTRAPGGVERPGVRLIHVPALSRHGRAAKIYSQLGHRLGFYLRTPNQAEGLSFAFAVAAKLVGTRYDLVFNQAGPFSGWVLSARRRFGGPPFVHKTAAGYSPLELIMKRQRPDLTIATSPFVEEWLRSQPPDTPVKCIPNGVDCSKFTPAEGPDLGHVPHELEDLERPIILFVGAMEPMKRPRLAIEAVSRLGRGSLAMIGDGSERDSIAAMGREQLGPGRFANASYVAQCDLPSYYRAADVFTLPSEEPFGIVFLEALACNTPIVAHSSPVQRWIAGDAGLTCNCEASEEYAAALQMALDTDFGNSPRMRALSFDWSIVASEYESIFCSVAESRAAARRTSMGTVAGRAE